MLAVCAATNGLFAKGFAVCLVLLRRIALSFLTIFWRRLVGFPESAPSSSSSANAQNWSCCYTTIRRYPMLLPASMLDCIPTPSGIGGNVGPTVAFRYRTSLGEVVSPLFFPLDHAIVKAIACEKVFESQSPLSRQSLADIASRACQALRKPISRTTVWRILDEDAIKPWQYEHWIYPRDPDFARKATRIVDLYAGHWYGEPLGKDDHIISSDEKTSIQARIRIHPGQAPGPHFKRRLEFEYERGGALQYLAAWDVWRGYVMGRCEPSTGIEPFGRLVTQVMKQEPYRSANRVFWIVDNGSSHRGEISSQRLAEAYPNAILIHTPVHASWLNQVEIYFSLIQRKVLTPNDFINLAQVEERLHLYEELSNRNPKPFAWQFNRAKLHQFLRRLEVRHVLPAAA
jgi:hypothetical protein